jgi:hypothetical protein
MLGVDETALEERHLVIELDTVDGECCIRRPDPLQRVARKKALMGQVVNGQDSWDPQLVPGKICRRHRGRPVVGMQDVGAPIRIDLAGRQKCPRRRQPGEAEVVVAPVAAGLINIGRPVTVIKLRANCYIDLKSIVCGRPADVAGGHLSQHWTVNHHLERLQLG